MSSMEAMSLAIFPLITQRLTPCAVALLMLTTPKMHQRMLSGGVSRLSFDSLQPGRLVNFTGPKDACAEGKCRCLLKWLHRFTHLKELVMNEQQYEMCLGAKEAGLPECLQYFVIVVRTSFLRWFAKSYRVDYDLSKVTPHLKQFRIAESAESTEAVEANIHIHKTFASQQFDNFLTTLPKDLESLLLPPIAMSVRSTHIFPSSLTRSSIALKWNDHHETLRLPVNLTSLSVFIKDQKCLDQHVQRMFPASLTELSIHVKASETPDESYRPKWVARLPKVSALKLTNVEHVRLADLPDVLTSLSLIFWYPAKGFYDSKGWTPHYLTRFLVERWPALEDLPSLPKSIDHLILRTERAMTITKMPDNLLKFHVPAKTTFVAPHWPSLLHTLKVNRSTDLPADALLSMPKSLTKLCFSIPSSVGSNSDDYLHDLPTTLKHLQIWNRKIDSSVFKALKNLVLLESLDFYAGDKKKERITIEITKFKWTLLEHLPKSLESLSLPVTMETFEPPSVLPSLLDLYLPFTTITFEDLQSTLTSYPQLRLLLANKYTLHPPEISPANELLVAHPLLTLRSVSPYESPKPIEAFSKEPASS